MADKIPGSRLLILEDAGHCAFLEEHEVLNAEIAAFADEVLVRQGGRPEAPPHQRPPGRGSWRVALGIEDLAVGHWTDPVGLTGCTVVVPPPGNVAAASVRGGGPGTRETDLLQPQAHVEAVSAVLLTGGSAFGLAAAQGVVDWCERRGLGYGRFGRPIPIVPAAVLFDLAVGDWDARPGPAEGEAACQAASTADGPQGNVGAGMGAPSARRPGRST